MARKCYGELVFLKIFVAIIVVLLNLHGVVEGRKIANEDYLNIMHRGIIKTIKSVQDGDVIDCVDIHKQPAFDHPLINELQIEPSSYPSELKEKKNTSEPELFQAWRKIEECPEGTIPIRRTQKLDVNGTFSFGHQKRPINHHEYAIVRQRGTGLHGGGASINVWSPSIFGGEFSASQIWVAGDTGDISTVDTIEAGWVVHEAKYHDTQPRIFTMWSTNNYQAGCYDMLCPGFVQTSRKIALGSPIAPVSVYGGKPCDISVNIYKDKNTGNWWVQVQGETLGYWPKTIFSTLADGATTVEWGGHILNISPGGHHTTTQMGSGHFSSEGNEKASYFKNLKVIDSADRQVDPDKLETFISRPLCYDLTISLKNPSYGTHFYYGGPGFSPKCL